MTDEKAKKQLATMLRSFTPGSILHLLAEVYGESAERARRRRDQRLYDQCRTVEAALIVVGYGVDAAHPR